jgi:hypothetical protein
VKTYIVSAKIVQYHRQGVHASSPAEALAMLKGLKHWGDNTFIETDSIELDPDPDEIEDDGEEA